MKVIIAGGRDYTDYGQLKIICDYKLFAQHPDIEIVSGGANGADKLGEKYAKENGYALKRFPANWDKYGKRAGVLRNEEMAKYADALIAFWDGKSKGTKNMIEVAQKHNIKVKIVNYTAATCYI